MGTLISMGSSILLNSFQSRRKWVSKFFVDRVRFIQFQLFFDFKMFQVPTSARNGTGAVFRLGCSKIRKCTSVQTILAIKVTKFAPVKLFSSNQDAVKHYFSKLLPLLAPLQHSNGGPIIAFQGMKFLSINILL